MFLTKWDPFETLSSLQSDIDNVFNRRLPAKSDQKKGLLSPDWYPAVDIHKDQEGYAFDLEAPGMEKSQFDVNVQNSILTIKGEKKSEVEKKEKNFLR